jgi:hypothetical protein
MKLSQRYQNYGFVQVIQVILKMEAEGSFEPLTRVYWATPPHVSDARTSQESSTAHTAERRLALLPSTCHSGNFGCAVTREPDSIPVDDILTFTSCVESDHVREHCWRVSMQTGDSWKDRMLDGYRPGTMVYSVAHALDRHTSMKTSNHSHRTLMSSDKNSGGKGSLYALFLAWSPTNTRYTQRMKQWHNFITQIIRTLFNIHGSVHRSINQ